MMNVGLVTFARSDYGTCSPILRAIQSDPALSLHLIVSGMHLSSEFGYTVREIEADGFEIADRVEMLVSSDTAHGAAASLGLGTIGFAGSLDRFRPDVLLLIGDRLELLSAACASLPFNVPLAHVSGGDITEGAIDNQIRHAISKLSHLHFVAMKEHADRLIQMGEEPWRVFVTGDPALDLISQMQFEDRKTLAASLGLDLTPPVIAVTYHPTTLGSSTAKDEVESLVRALKDVDATLVIGCPNADPGNQVIAGTLRKFAGSKPRAGFFTNLGQQKYYSLLALADCMVGNSSSGIWEAPSFQLPVVNVGDRQAGRLRAGNVIDVAVEPDAIVRGLRQALSPEFRESLRNVTNPYGDGQSAQRIVNALRAIEPGPPTRQKLLRKRFIDLQR
jgi:GDP/UDP-N,N'-diacetylbacillosamine 2-epimerase (hydrolysing)